MQFDGGTVIHVSTSTGQSQENRSEIVFYQTEDGRGRIQVRLEGETAWLPQALIAELFRTSPQSVTIHIGEI